jgi:hypothetical protein
MDRAQRLEHCVRQGPNSFLWYFGNEKTARSQRAIGSPQRYHGVRQVLQHVIRMDYVNALRRDRRLLQRRLEDSDSEASPTVIGRPVRRFKSNRVPALGLGMGNENPFGTANVDDTALSNSHGQVLEPLSEVRRELLIAAGDTWSRRKLLVVLLRIKMGQ